MQHAHQKGIIHRDIKPSNVLVTLHDGVPVPKVIDFGVAKATGQQLTDKTLFTGFAQLIGTPLYMSPEQAELIGLDIDTRSDIYSLGVLLYELLTGTTPFDPATLSHGRVRRDPPDHSRRGAAAAEHADQHARANCDDGLGQPPDRPAAAEPRLVRGELDWIVMKALEKDRTRRYETANDFASDVMRYLTDQPVEACPPSRRYRVAKYARRNRVALTTGVIIAVALLGGTVVSVWQAMRATRASHNARLMAAELALDKGQLLGESGDASLALLWLSRSLKLVPPGSDKLQMAIRTSLRAWERQAHALRLTLPPDGGETALAVAPTARWSRPVPPGINAM